MKFYYIYSDNGACFRNGYGEIDLLEGRMESGIFHSKIIGHKTMYRESEGAKFVHIFKERKANGCSFWIYYTSYCI